MNDWFYLLIKRTNAKGQLISEAKSQAMKSSKKRTNDFFLLLCDMFSFGFLEEIKDPKKTFRNYRGSPDSTNFWPPGDRTIAKIVLIGD